MNRINDMNSKSLILFSSSQLSWYEKILRLNVLNLRDGYCIMQYSPVGDYYFKWFRFMTQTHKAFHRQSFLSCPGKLEPLNKGNQEHEQHHPGELRSRAHSLTNTKREDGLVWLSLVLTTTIQESLRDKFLWVTEDRPVMIHAPEVDWNRRS